MDAQVVPLMPASTAQEPLLPVTNVEITFISHFSNAIMDLQRPLMAVSTTALFSLVGIVKTMLIWTQFAFYLCAETVLFSQDNIVKLAPRHLSMGAWIVKPLVNGGIVPRQPARPQFARKLLIVVTFNGMENNTRSVMKSILFVWIV